MAEAMYERGKLWKQSTAKVILEVIYFWENQTNNLLKNRSLESFSVDNLISKFVRNWSTL